MKVARREVLDILNMERYKYYAFISYSHKDEEWAKWLQHEFEHYHLPAICNGKPGVPSEFRPIFRDVDELSGGELKPQISNALSESANLIIICSPNSANSKYVNEEILEFIEIGKKRGENNILRIYPFIISGIPHSMDKPEEECFTPALNRLPIELIAGDATKHGREHAFIKILAGTLRESKINFSMLWDRFERERIEEERYKREERDKLLIVQSRYLSEKSIALTAKGDSYKARLLALEALPKDLNNPERPYCAEAEFSLRTAIENKGFILEGHRKPVRFAKFSYDDKYVITIDYDYERYVDNYIYIWHTLSGELISKFKYKGVIFFGDLDPRRMRFVGGCVTKSGEHKMCIQDAKSGKVIKVFNSKFNAAVFSDDGKYLAAYCGKGSLMIYDAESYKLIKRIKAPDSGFIAGERLTFGYKNESVILEGRLSNFNEFDLKSGKEIYSSWKGFSDEREVRGKNKKVLGEQLHNLKSEVAEVDYLLNHRPYNFAINISPDLKYLASSCKKSDIDVFEISSGRHLYALKGHVNEVTSVNWNSKGNLLISSSEDRTAKVWDLDLFRMQENVKKHSDFIIDLAFDKSGRYIKTECCQDNVVLWNAKNGDIISDSSKIEELNKLFDSGSSKIKKCDSNTIKVKVGNVEKCYTDEDFSIIKYKLSKDGKYLAVGNSIGVIRILNAKSLQLVKELNKIYKDEDGIQYVKDCLNEIEIYDYISPVISLDFSPDGSKIVSVWLNGSCIVWDIDSGSYMEYPTPDVWINSAVFNPDGTGVIVAGEFYPDYKIGLWNIFSNEIQERKVEIGMTFDKRYDKRKPNVAHATLTPNRKILAVAVNNHIRFYNPRDLKEIRIKKGHDTKVLRVFFTGDDKYVVSQSDDTRVCVWDAKNLEWIDSFIGDCNHEDDCVAEYEKELFEYVEKDKVTMEFKDGYKIKPQLEWISPSGKYTARALRKTEHDNNLVVNTVAIFEKESGAQICSLGKMQSDVTDVSFSKDEKRIVAACSDGEVKMWELQPLQQLIDSSRARLGRRSLSSSDRAHYYL